MEATIYFLQIFTFLFLITGYSFFLIFLERKLLARSQRRVGPNELGKMGQLQVFADILKLFSKQVYLKPFGFKLYRGFAGVISVLLSYGLVFLILGASFGFYQSSTQLLLIFINILLMIIVDGFISFIYIDTQDESAIQKRILIQVLGFTIFSLCISTVILNFGSTLLQHFSEAQGGFPYLTIFFSPFLFIAGVVSFIAIFFILPIFPVEVDAKSAFSGTWHGWFFVSSYIWRIGVSMIWTAIFFGGMPTDGEIFSFLAFFFRSFFILLVIFWIQRSLPKVRIDNILQFGMKKMLPLSLIAFMGELFWLLIN